MDQFYIQLKYTQIMRKLIENLEVTRHGVMDGTRTLEPKHRLQAAD